MSWLQYGGRLRKLPGGPVVLGSGDDAMLRVDEVDLMRRHLVVHARDDHVEVSAFSPDVVVVAGGRQVGTEPCSVDFGAPFKAGSAVFRVWKEQPDNLDPDESRPAAAFLVDLEARAAYPLDRLATSIGRSSGNVIRLSDATASRFHATVRREAGGHALHVIGSAGGTVNGRRVASPCLLAEGDVIEMAYTALRFTFGPVPPDVRIIPPPAPETVGTERPTMASERISLGERPLRRPAQIFGAALLIGLAAAVAAALLAVLVR